MLDRRDGREGWVDAWCQRPAAAFTLVELLITTALLVIIVGVVAQITNQTSRIWQTSSSRVQAFQEARAAYESMTRKLSQATLNTYYDYYDASNKSRLDFQKSGANLATFVPKTYDRISDLHFISGKAQTFALKKGAVAITTQTHAVFFQAPLGYSATYGKADNALNACGFYLSFDTDKDFLPKHVATNQERWRMRLMEMTQRTESLTLYDPLATTPNDWFVKKATESSRVLADNVIALALLPKLSNHEDDPAQDPSNPPNVTDGVSLAPSYNYNSRVPLRATSDTAWTGATPAFPPDSFTAYPAGGGTRKASRHHQLPPMMRVVMVVIDESSADRLARASGSSLPSAIDIRTKGLFEDARKLNDDIRFLEDICAGADGNKTGNKQQLTYRVFNTEIAMREAKWSND